MDYQHFLNAFLKHGQNNLDYLTQNMIHPVIQVYHSMFELNILNLLLLYELFMFFHV